MNLMLLDIHREREFYQNIENFTDSVLQFKELFVTILSILMDSSMNIMIEV
jgi:hypothetical protein